MALTLSALAIPHLPRRARAELVLTIIAAAEASTPRLCDRLNGAERLRMADAIVAALSAADPEEIAEGLWSDRAAFDSVGGDLVRERLDGRESGAC